MISNQMPIDCAATRQLNIILPDNQVKKVIAVASLLMAFASPAISAPRTANPRLVKIGTSKCLNPEQSPGYHCIKFHAKVDIDSGHLRAWAVDPKGKAYVVGRLSNGEEVYVIDVFRLNGRWFAEIQFTRAGCTDMFECTARVDLRYLR